MKLFQIIIDNDKEYEDHDWQFKLIACSHISVAYERAEDWLDEEYTNSESYFKVTEISEVDGCKITVAK